MFTNKTEQFEGTLAELTQAVRDKKVDILSVSISDLIEQKEDEIENAEKNSDVELLADYLDNMSELVQTKSRTINSDKVDDEEDLEDLAAIKEEYQKYATATEYFEKVLEKDMRGYGQESAPKFEIQSTFTPPKDLNMDGMLAIFKKVLSAVKEEEKAPAEAIKIDKINVAKKLEQIKSFIFAKKKVAFSDLLKLAKTKTEVVVSFLAILEMIKDGVISVLQGEHFDDIYIEARI